MASCAPADCPASTMRDGSPPNLLRFFRDPVERRAHIDDLLRPLPLRCVAIIDCHDHISLLCEMPREPILAGGRSGLPRPAVDLHDDRKGSIRRRPIHVERQRHAIGFRKRHASRHSNLAGNTRGRLGCRLRHRAIEARERVRGSARAAPATAVMRWRQTPGPGEPLDAVWRGGRKSTQRRTPAAKSTGAISGDPTARG